MPNVFNFRHEKRAINKLCKPNRFERLTSKHRTHFFLHVILIVAIVLFCFVLFRVVYVIDAQIIDEEKISPSFFGLALHNAMLCLSLLILFWKQHSARVRNERDRLGKCWYLSLVLRVLLYAKKTNSNRYNRRHNVSAVCTVHNKRKRSTNTHEIVRWACWLAIIKCEWCKSELIN